MSPQQRKPYGLFSGRHFHWVGDGFHVHNLIPGTDDLAQLMNPLVLVDYNPPHTFSPSTTPRGVGPHPHRGFETVTLVLEGELLHEDSAGNKGSIEQEEVQWMTAASGVLHQEYHSLAFSQQGGIFHAVQIWINLPAANKMQAPGYQTIRAADIIRFSIADGVQALLYAGQYAGQQGKAITHTPVLFMRILLDTNASCTLSLPHNERLMLLGTRGNMTVQDKLLKQADMMLFVEGEGDISVHAKERSELLVLSVAPLKEPLATHGPFVMNTIDELRQAILDFEQGKFGRMQDLRSA